jgi:hypothetical protein
LPGRRLLREPCWSGGTVCQPATACAPSRPGHPSLKRRSPTHAFPTRLSTPASAAKPPQADAAGYPWHCKPTSPSLVVIELGANDGLRGLPVAAMSTNLQAMIDASRQAGAKVLLIGMRMPPNYGPDYTTPLRKSLPGSGQGQQAAPRAFHDGRLRRPTRLFSAGRHPSGCRRPAPHTRYHLARTQAAVALSPDSTRNTSIEPGAPLLRPSRSASAIGRRKEGLCPFTAQMR